MKCWSLRKMRSWARNSSLRGREDAILPMHAIWILCFHRLSAIPSSCTAVSMDIATRMSSISLKDWAFGLRSVSYTHLQEATDALDAFGSLYLKQAMASGVIPQITAIFGTCGGGLSVIPALTDFTFMEKDAGKLFVNSPNAIPGNTAAKLDTSSAEFQSEKSGLVDDIGSEEEILESIRSLVCICLLYTSRCV